MLVSAVTDPSSIFLSSIANVALLTVVVVPSTCKLPLITTVPVLSPTAAGSMVNVAGPLSVPVMFKSASTCSLPVPLVSITISSLLFPPIILFWKYRILPVFNSGILNVAGTAVVLLTVNAPLLSVRFNDPIVTLPGPTYTCAQRLLGLPKSRLLSSPGIILVATCGK